MRLQGKDGKFTWVAGSGGNALESTECLVVQHDIGTRALNVTPIGKDWDEYTSLGYGGRMTLEFPVNSGVSTSVGPAIPDGTLGTLTLNKNKAATSAGSWSGSFLIERMLHSIGSGGTQGTQRVRYVGYWSGEVTET